MDLCPKCRTAARVDLQEGRQVFRCRNPQCDAYDRILEEDKEQTKLLSPKPGERR